MKSKIYLTSILLSMTTVAMGAVQNAPAMDAPPVMKALPIYSNTLIDKAPAGETVTGIRDCYSSYFQNGNHERGFEQGVMGEYVLGEDGNIYLRGVCYDAAQISSKTDTYLKLEKVDDTTYVAHTPQLIWVDDSSDGSPFTAYATRVVFTQYSATSFGYEVQQTPDGAYDTDVYFTFQDGRLSQANMNTTEMNGEIFPEELIGFTNSTGKWIGFGDGCITIYQAAEKPVVLPEGAEVKEKTMEYNLLHVRDIVLDNAVLIKYAEVGDDLYLSNPSSSSSQWIKGTIDRQKGTATFHPQYLGIDEEKGLAIWFTPALYDKYLEILNEDTGFGDWFRTYRSLKEIVFDYNDGDLSLKKPGQAFCFSHSADEILLTEAFADPALRLYEDASFTPAPVKFTKFEEYDDLWGFGVAGFAIPCMSTDGIYINPDELYYNVFVDGSETPFVFSSKDYVDMEVGPMTDVPYSYNEYFDFRVNGINHTFYFYHDWNKIGIQVIQKHAGVETRSEMVYAGKDGFGAVKDTFAGKNNSGRVVKYLKDGQLRIVGDGVEYNVLGMKM